MGGITSALQLLPMITQGIGLVNDIVQPQFSFADEEEQQQQALRELQQKQDLDMRARQENAELEREKIELDTQDAERRRRDALKRAVARQRASFGSAGVGSGAGSSQAVLLGLFEESDAERAEREKLDNLRVRAQETDLAQTQRLNVLQRTQLQERNKISGLSNDLNRVSSLSNAVSGLTTFI